MILGGAAGLEGGERGQDAKRIARLGVVLLALLVLVAASLSVGAKDIAIGAIVDALRGVDTAEQSTIIMLRLPRTLAGVVAGLALGLSGAMMQALTRNPLADPGILGINAGAALAMVLAIGLLGVVHPLSLVWFSFAGAALATLAVYGAAAATRGGATPVRLILAGVAIGSVLKGLTSALVMTDPESFDRMLSWDVGSLAITGYERLAVTTPFIVLGGAISLFLAPTLNIIALGDDSAHALGASVLRVRALTIFAVMILTGAATAAVGPIGFVGLMVPHLARAIGGSDQRWIFAFTLLLAPMLLLAADIMGRLSMRPAEIQVGIVTAVVGAPVLVWLVRSRRMAAL